MTRPRHESTQPASTDPSALHCLCGRLVARWIAGAIELRCQRCKRTLRLELDLDGAIRVVPVDDEPRG